METVICFTIFSCTTLLYIRKRTVYEKDNLWLEEIDSKRSLDWVVKQNERLPFKGDGPLAGRILEILNSKDKIPYVSCLQNGVYYNLWKDDKHIAGIWRRVKAEDYLLENPPWETVLDVDELNELEPGNDWRFQGYTQINDEERDLVLIKLSRGGADASVVREFSLSRKNFLPPSENPFFLPEAKSSVSYVSRDLLLVGTDFKTKDSLTDSGYPRQTRLWKRGTPLNEAEIVFTGAATDVSVTSYYTTHNGYSYHITYRGLTFYTNKKYIHSIEGDPKLKINNSPVEVRIPESAHMSTFANQILVELRKDWLGFVGGSLLSIPVEKLILSQDPLKSDDFFVLFVPQDGVAMHDYSNTKNTLAIIYMENVVSKLMLWKFTGDNKWEKQPVNLAGLSKNYDSFNCWPVNHHFSDFYWTTSEGYTTPTTLGLINGLGESAPKQLKHTPEKYDATDVVVKQQFATSLDGTKIPYFLVYKDNKASTFPRKCLLYGYGGFEISLTPYYSATYGVSWIEKGYVYVVANIRGGGEFGPGWHQAALRENRCKAYEDFAAVAKDLIDNKYTTSKLLGCMGGSNGGLLVGNAFVKMYEYFSAVVCKVPLLDMKRYNHLLAGASWMAEYGNPDVASDWEFLKNYSPYHNIDSKKLKKYPPILFATSTRDDRVHPSHARRMAKKLIDMGFQNAYLYENIEGGHGGASTNENAAKLWALSFEFLENMLNK